MMKKCYILSLLLCVGAGQALAQEKTADLSLNLLIQIFMIPMINIIMYQ